jgi:hypothetical protein
MQSKKKQSKQIQLPVRHEIRTKETELALPGAAGQAALTAAEMRELNRCAKEIEEYMEASKMERIIDEIQKELGEGTGLLPRLRLARE